MKHDPLLAMTLSGSDCFGVEVDRRELGSLGSDDLDEFRSLVDRHGVVFVRRFGCDQRDLETLARHFGELQTHPVKKLTGDASTVSVITDDLMRPPAGFPWHTDLSWLQQPPHYGFLQALEIPNHRGDTLWADLVGLHRTLAPDVRNLVDDLDAVHAIDASLLASVRSHHGAEVANELRRCHEPVLHPLVRSHPTSGEPLVAICPMYARSIDGLDPIASELLISQLNAHLDDTDVSIRW